MIKPHTKTNKIIALILAILLIIPNLNTTSAIGENGHKTPTDKSSYEPHLYKKDKEEKSEEFRKKFDKFRRGEEFENNPYAPEIKTYDEYQVKVDECWKVAFDITCDEKETGKIEKSKRILIEKLFYELGKIAYLSGNFLDMSYVVAFFHNLYTHNSRFEPGYDYLNFEGLSCFFSQYWGESNPFKYRLISYANMLNTRLDPDELDSIDRQLEELKSENKDDGTAVTLIECLQGLAVESYRMELEKYRSEPLAEDSESGRNEVSAETSKKIYDKNCVESCDEPATEKTEKHSENYTFIQELGWGAYGRVDLYMDKLSHRKVAIKTLHKGKGYTEEQLKLMQKINSPYVVKSYDIAVFGDKNSLVMEYVDGGAPFMRAILTRGYSKERILDICIQFAKAFQAFENAGLCHSDLNTHTRNVLIDRHDHVKIIDCDNPIPVPKGYNTECALSYIASILMVTYKELYDKINKEFPTTKFYTSYKSLWRDYYFRVGIKEFIDPRLEPKDLVEILENMKAKDK